MGTTTTAAAAMSMDTDVNRNERDYEERLAYFLSEDGKVNLSNFYKELRQVGISTSDPRLKVIMTRLRKAQANAIILNNDVFLDAKTFQKCIAGEGSCLLMKAFTADLVIPEFSDLCAQLTDIYNLC